MKLSIVARAGPSKWIGLQVGIETGSERLAQIHMPNKTLPLRMGPDGSWPEIVVAGCLGDEQVPTGGPPSRSRWGRSAEMPEDNWETVAMVNWLSDSTLDDGRPFEFTVTPMQNVPLGLMKSRKFGPKMMDTSQLAVYHASYRHLAKVAARDAVKDSSGSFLTRVGTAALIALGGRVMLEAVSAVCRKGGLDLEKAATYGAEHERLQAPALRAI